MQGGWKFRLLCSIIWERVSCRAAWHNCSPCAFVLCMPWGTIHTTWEDGDCQGQAVDGRCAPASYQVAVRRQVAELGSGQVRIPGSQYQAPGYRQEANSRAGAEPGSEGGAEDPQKDKVWSRSKQAICIIAQAAPQNDFLVYVLVQDNQWVVGAATWALLCGTSCSV